MLLQLIACWNKLPVWKLNVVFCYKLKKQSTRTIWILLSEILGVIHTDTLETYRDGEVGVEIPFLQLTWLQDGIGEWQKETRGGAYKSFLFCFLTTHFAHIFNWLVSQNDFKSLCNLRKFIFYYMCRKDVSVLCLVFIFVIDIEVVVCRVFFSPLWLLDFLP